jgi:hypothetical protein
VSKSFINKSGGEGKYHFKSSDSEEETGPIGKYGLVANHDRHLKKQDLERTFDVKIYNPYGKQKIVAKRPY